MGSPTYRSSLPQVLAGLGDGPQQQQNQPQQMGLMDLVKFSMAKRELQQSQDRIDLDAKSIAATDKLAEIQRLKGDVEAAKTPLARINANRAMRKEVHGDKYTGYRYMVAGTESTPEEEREYLLGLHAEVAKKVKEFEKNGDTEGYTEYLINVLTDSKRKYGTVLMDRGEQFKGTLKTLNTMAGRDMEEGTLERWHSSVGRLAIDEMRIVLGHILPDYDPAELDGMPLSEAAVSGTLAKHVQDNPQWHADKILSLNEAIFRRIMRERAPHMLTQTGSNIPPEPDEWEKRVLTEFAKILPPEEYPEGHPQHGLEFKTPPRIDPTSFIATPPGLERQERGMPPKDLMKNLTTPRAGGRGVSLETLGEAAKNYQYFVYHNQGGKILDWFTALELAADKGRLHIQTVGGQPLMTGGDAATPPAEQGKPPSSVGAGRGFERDPKTFDYEKGAEQRAREMHAAGEWQHRESPWEREGRQPTEEELREEITAAKHVQQQMPAIGSGTMGSLGEQARGSFERHTGAVTPRDSHNAHARKLRAEDQLQQLYGHKGFFRDDAGRLLGMGKRWSRTVHGQADLAEAKKRDAVAERQVQELLGRGPR